MPTPRLRVHAMGRQTTCRALVNSGGVSEDNTSLRAIALIAAVIGSLDYAPQLPVATSGGGGELSSSVSATFTAHGPPPNGPWTLELLVLWRGSPGWWQTPGIGSSTSVDSPIGGQRRLVTQSVSVGGRALELQFDPQTREARLQTQVVALGENNVLLVDDVDGATGARIVGSVQVEPVFEQSANGVDALVRQSPELLDFLRCDAAMADPNMQAMMARRCAQIRDNIGPPQSR